MAKKYSSNNSGKGITAIMIAIIAVVFALGIFTVYGTVAGNMKQNKLDSYNASISLRADALGLETDEFLSLYGLSDSGLKGSDNEHEAYEKMTLANYVKYNNGGAEMTEDEFNEFKEAKGIEDDVTMDTTDMDVKYQYAMYVQAQQEAQEAAQKAAQEESAAVDIADEETDAEGINEESAE